MVRGIKPPLIFTNKKQIQAKAFIRLQYIVLCHSSFVLFTIHFLPTLKRIKGRQERAALFSTARVFYSVLFLKKVGTSKSSFSM